MRIFHELILEEYVEGGSVQASRPFGDVFGLGDTLVLTVVATNASGISPTLTVGLAETWDCDESGNNPVGNIIDTTALSTTGETLLRGTFTPSSPAFPDSASLLLDFVLGGTDPAVQLRAWATVRGQASARARRADLSSPASTLQVVKQILDQTQGRSARVSAGDYFDPRTLSSYRPGGR